ncbi:MarR family transcriptional regulator [Tropicibacter sp. R15_0]|uniref:MarR family winged helix-turn-helix transcriptional regulator n=1 Tax=Tropicibacter sp. R15_0 TaxID=2821101 RepID=UPI001ADAFA63|nr:MarR family transcriptional regulator [Tropicibacter sp. R15_0]MBO9464176.1 MarR family transcriptional regulator [Tropicibacter sp. R15_0]
MSFLLRRSLVQRFEAEGLDVSAEEWAVLLILQSVPDLTATELSDRSMRDKTTITRTLDRLERKGLVLRLRDTKDRRSVRLSLSPMGQAVFEELARVAQGLIQQTLAGIAPEDVEQALMVMKRMAANLTEDQHGL